MPFLPAKRIHKGSSSRYFEVLEDGGFDPNVNAVGSKSSERHPVDIHLPAMQVPGYADHRLGGFAGGDVETGSEVDLPFFRQT